MPELPDIVLYIEALEPRILNQTLERVQVSAPFLLRTAAPPVSSVEGRKVVELRRVGKRICIGLEEELWLVLHLMIAGRLHWHDRAPIRTGSGPGSPAGQPGWGGDSDRVEPEQEAAAGGRSARSLKTGSVSGGVPAFVSTTGSSGRVTTIRGPKNRLAMFEFTSGTLSLTEAGTQRRASLHVVRGDVSLQRFNPGGLEIFEIDLDSFAKVLQSENHTLKRALTDPRLFSGIGNAYSDEILWEAQLSPIALTQKLTSDEIERLFNSTRATLSKWIDLLRTDLTQTVSLRADKIRTVSGSDRVAPGQEGTAGSRSAAVTQTVSSRARGSSPSMSEGVGFPEKVTAFRPEMAVHGKYQQPCPRCGNKIQRIRYASNETNYCPVCQTAGKLLADRALSRLLRSDWPRTADELEGLVPQ